MLKANCSEEQKRMAEEQKKKAIYTENGITYDTRPIYKTMSNVHPETIQSAPQVEGALSSTDVATTHKGMPIDSERQISQPELAQDVLRHPNYWGNWQKFLGERQTVLAVPGPPG